MRAPRSIFCLMICLALVNGAGAIDIHVDNFATGGASTDMILAAVYSHETTATHHQVWVVEGGLNDIDYTHGNMPYVIAGYTQRWTTIVNYARQLGAEIYFCELTPITSEYDAVVYWAAPANPKIQMLNQQLHAMGVAIDFPVISVYDDLLPHWTNAADAWCRNIANTGSPDGCHPNALGAEALARHVYNAIRPAIFSRGVTSIALFGDSIVSTGYLPQDQKIHSWLEKLAAAEINRAKNWQAYK